MRASGWLVVAALAATALTACGGLPAAQTRAYLDSIPLGDLAALAQGKSVAPIVYSGSYTVAMPPGAMAMYRTMKVDVTLDAPNHVGAITVTSPEQLDNADFGQKISADVIAQQSLAVDSISGASFSSKAFLKAVEDALSQ